MGAGDRVQKQEGQRRVRRAEKDRKLDVVCVDGYADKGCRRSYHIDGAHEVQLRIESVRQRGVAEAHIVVQLATLTAVLCAESSI
jgi:hypothetical protein